MPRFVPLFTGLALAGAITYKFRNDLLQDQIDIKHRLQDAKSTLEKAVTTEPTYNRTSYLSDSQKYVSNRLVPSGNLVFGCIQYALECLLMIYYSEGLVEQSSHECSSIFS